MWAKVQAVVLSLCSPVFRSVSAWSVVSGPQVEVVSHGAHCALVHTVPPEGVGAPGCLVTVDVGSIYFRITRGVDVLRGPDRRSLTVYTGCPTREGGGVRSVVYSCFNS